NFIKFLAVMTRFFGKGLAYANSVWIVLHCIFLSIGFYERCWCNCNYPVMGDKWILDAQELQNDDQNIRGFWGGFIAVSIILMIVYSGYLLVKSRKQNISSNN